MHRPLRVFQPAAVPLERRILLAHVHVPLSPPVATVDATTTVAVPTDAASLGSVGFLGTPSSAGIEVIVSLRPAPTSTPSRLIQSRARRVACRDPVA